MDTVSTLISPTMVDRSTQFEALRSALGHAADGESTVVLVGGEAGVGKSRLLTELATEAGADGSRIISGQCVELGGDGVAYAPIAGLLRDLSGQIGHARLHEIAGPGGGILSGLLPVLGGPPVDVDEGRGRLFEVFTVVLEHLADEQPLVVMIEDLHWADRSTRDLLRFVIRALGRARVLLLGTYRTDEMHRTHPLRPFLAELDRLPYVQRVTVPRLSKKGVVQQLRHIRPDISKRLTDQIFRRSGGIPFFVEELAAAKDDALPETLRDLLMVRVAQLSDRAQDLLRLIAVGGNSVDHALLEAVHAGDPEDLDKAARELISAGVLRVEGSEYKFRHALMRESVHDDLLPGEGGRLHRRYAETLERCPDYLSTGSAGAEIAHHWNAAHDQERAFPAMITAAEFALSKFAYGEALKLFERALELWDQVSAPEEVTGGDHADLLSRASRAANDAGEMERSLSLIDAARSEVSSDNERLARMAYYRGKLLSELGREESIEVLTEGLALVPDALASPIRARLLQTLAARHMLDGDMVDGIRVATEAIDVARAVGDPVAEFRAHDLLGPCLIESGQIDEGFAELDLARTLAGSSPRLQVGYQINISDSLQILGRSAEAAEHGRAGIEQANAAGLARSLGAMLLGNTAEPLLATGDWPEAHRLIQRGLELDPPHRHLLQLRLLETWLRLWRGDPEGAAASLCEVHSGMARRQMGPQYTVPAIRVAAELALHHDDPDGAWSLVVPFLDGCRRLPGYQLPTLWLTARVLAERRRAGTADNAEFRRQRDAVMASFDMIGDWGISATWRSFAVAELTVGPAADDLPGSAAAPWQQALEMRSEQSGPAHLLPYATYRLALALLAEGDRETAVRTLTAAGRAADELGAGLVRGWVDDLDRRLGAHRDPTGSERTDDCGLTPRELEVLRLITVGRSNRQIGAELFISTKTASVHVSNILAKLGVGARGEAAAYANRMGLFEPEALRA